MSIPQFLVPDQTVTKNGEGEAVELAGGDSLIELTLGILEVIEQQSLDVNIHGSADGVEWTPKPIMAFPQKFYAGTSKIVLDLGKLPDTRYVRARWKVGRWGNWGADPPRFRFFVFAEPVR